MPTTPSHGFTRVGRDLGNLLLSARAVRAGWLSRAGRAYCWAGAIAGALLLVIAHRAGDPGEEQHRILRTALEWMSLAAGLVACAAARDLEGEERSLCVDDLRRLRAVRPRDARRARLLATIWVVTRALGLPALVLSVWAVFWAPVAPPVLRAVTWFAGSALHAVAFGLVFGALARAASWLSEKHARLVFLLLVLVPHAAHEISGEVPSVVAGFVWFMDRLGTAAGFA